MQINSFREMYLAELQELCSAEHMILEALRLEIFAVKNDRLKQAFQQHTATTHGRRQQLDQILRRHGARPGEHKDQAAEALIRESRKMTAIVSDPALRDAALIASWQKILHYKIAAYGTVATYAKMLGYADDQRTLHEALDEEKQMDARLTALAEEIVNPEAVATA
jgi:ferritin-like metal-binding protein YciE